VKAKKEKNKEPKESAPQNKNAETEFVPENDSPSELSEPRWSVVSFESCAASSLTYEQATEKLAELEAQKVSGLCIITDEAAVRINKK